MSAEDAVVEAVAVAATAAMATVERVPMETTPSSSNEVKTPRKRRSLFKSVRDLDTRNASPGEQNLMGMVRRREDHIRKLKRICKLHVKRKRMEKLDNMMDQPVYKKIFKGTQILISIQT